jgi:hypothetical protein
MAKRKPKGAAKVAGADWYVDTALDHVLADKRCGRAWVCACAACRTARKGSIKALAKAILDGRSIA